MVGTDPKRIAGGMYWDLSLCLFEGCTKVSQACKFCWSERQSVMRANHPNQLIRDRHQGVVKDGHWTGKVEVHLETLDKAERKTTPKVYAIWNEPFHESVPDHIIMTMMDRIVPLTRHTFIITTKQAERMSFFFGQWRGNWGTYLPPHIWVGVTAESKGMAERRIKWLKDAQAYVNMLIIEPALEYFDLEPYKSVFKGQEVNPGWVVVGGESGKNDGVRPMHPDWVRRWRDWCVENGVPFFFKGWGEWLPEDHLHEGVKFPWHHTSRNYHRWDEAPEGFVFNQRPKEYAPEKTSCYLDFESVRVGKKQSGRILDGRTWDELPHVLEFKDLGKEEQKRLEWDL